MNHTVISVDVSFDENFISSHVRLDDRTRFPGGIALQPHPQDITQNDQVEVTGTLTTTDQRGEFVREPDNPPNLVLDVEEPDAMTQAQWLETYRPYPTLDEREEESSIWDTIQPSTLRRSPRLLQQFSAAHAQAKSPPPPRNQGIQKSLIRFSNMVKWKVPTIKE